MTGYRILTVILLILVSIAFSVPQAGAAKKEPAQKTPASVRKQKRGNTPFLAQWWRNKKKRESLALSTDQVQTLERIVKESQKVRADLQKRLKGADSAYNQLMSQGRFNDPKLKKITAEMVAARTGLIKNRVSTRVAIGKAFTPPQVKKILQADPKSFHYNRGLVGRKKMNKTGLKTKKGKKKNQ